MTRNEYESYVLRYCRSVLIAQKYDLATVTLMTPEQVRSQAAMHTDANGMLGWIPNLQSMELTEEQYQAAEQGIPETQTGVDAAVSEDEDRKLNRKAAQAHLADIKALGERLDKERRESV